MTDEIFSEDDKSEFNAGIATLQRCHEIKKFLASATIREDTNFYLKHIKMFYKELWPMMNPKTERPEQWGYWMKGKEIEKKIKSGKSITDDDLEFLEEWELELRDIEQTKNMNIPKKGDSRWGLAKR